MHRWGKKGLMFQCGKVRVKQEKLDDLKMHCATIKKTESRILYLEKISK